MRVGASRSAAAEVAHSLVEADIRGVTTHGIVRLPSYRAQALAGEVNPAATPRILNDRGAALFVDGAHAFGAVTANFCIDLVVERAREFGVGIASAKHGAHFGTAAHYALRAAHRGFVGIAAANTPAVMAPYGGRRAALGNNPFAIAAPTPEGRAPFVLDMAQSVVARGHIKLAEMQGREIPRGWALGPDGEPTSDPTLALSGALLAFGGYKGSGLALAIEVLTSVLAGAGLSPELTNTSMTGAAGDRPDTVVGSVGQLFAAIDPDAFAGREQFCSGLARLADAIKAVEPAAGHDEVLLPGELEFRAAELASTEGVPLPPATIALLEELAESLSLPFPTPAESSCSR